MRTIQKIAKLPKIELASYKGRRFPLWVNVLAALALAGVLVFGALLGQVLRGAQDNIIGDSKAMVVLGCQVKPWGPSVLLQDRLDKALEFWKEHPKTVIVVSGAQGPDEPSTEARAMADYLTAKGVPEESILLEEGSRNTIQNLVYSKQLLEEQGYDVSEGVVVVSNGFHLARARMLAGRAGYENVSVLAAPSSHVPSRLKMYIREPIALVKSFVLDR